MSKDAKEAMALLKEKAKALLNKEGKVTNYERRRLYSEVCLFEQDLSSDSSSYSEELLAIAEKLNFGFRKSPNIFSWLLELCDEAVRIIAVWLFLVNSAVLLAIPIIMLSIFVSVQKITVIAKKFVGYCILALSGISLTVQGLETNVFDKSIVTLLTFSHSSTMDAFILAAAVPCRHYSLVRLLLMRRSDVYAMLFSLLFFSSNLGGRSNFIKICAVHTLTFFLSTTLLANHDTPKCHPAGKSRAVRNSFFQLATVCFRRRSNRAFEQGSGFQGLARSSHKCPNGRLCCRSSRRNAKQDGPTVAFQEGSFLLVGTA